jgi:peptidyl-prolyl cis-trans isomerase C
MAITKIIQYPFLALVLACSAVISAARAQGSTPRTITTWSNGQVSTEDLAAELLKGPPESRASAQEDPATVSKLIDGIQLYRELARRAKIDGVANDPLVQRAVLLAQERELGNLYLQKQIQIHIEALGDLAGAAREQYSINSKQYSVPERRALAHILISNRTRSDSEALKIAEELRSKLVEDPKKFVELASNFTDDAGSRQRGGGLGMVARGTMVKEFETMAFSMTKPEQLSEIVKTQFGYHIIKLISIEPARMQSFDEVKDRIISEMRQRASNSARDKITREIRNDSSIKVDDKVFEDFTGSKRIK